MVTVFDISGLTKAYRSVLSASGSPLMNGASRWLDAWLWRGVRPMVSANTATRDNPRLSTSCARREAAPERFFKPRFMPFSFILNGLSPVNGPQDDKY